MHLQINGEQMVSKLQEDFSQVFPYLKIEFYRNGSKRQERYPATKMIAPSRLLKDAWVYKKDKGQLKLSGDMSVTDFENALMDEFGLSAQVFRHAGNVWLETTMTDNWTLKQQNEHGRELSTGINTTNDSTSLGSRSGSSRL